MQIGIERFHATRKSRPVVFFTERLDRKPRFFAGLGQSESPLFLVAGRGRASRTIRRGRIQDRIHKNFPGFIAEMQNLEILDRLRGRVLSTGNYELR